MNMSAFKLSFRIHRYDFDPDNMTQDKDSFKIELQELLFGNHISTHRIYSPSRTSIKVLFLNEEELNKVFSCRDTFEIKGFYPRISLALRASRTIFCSGFDPILLRTYDKYYIVNYLENKGWKIANIHIFKSNTTFKIEFESKEIA